MNARLVSGVLIGSALLLMLLSFGLTSSYGVHEPIYDYQREDAVAFIGLSTSVIALWLIWSLGVLALVVFGILSRWWLLALLVAAFGVFMAVCCLDGYLNDLEHYLLSPEQQTRLGIPPLE
jgi:O-antigen/teichoic acid export membrane protein